MATKAKASVKVEAVEPEVIESCNGLLDSVKAGAAAAQTAVANIVPTVGKGMQQALYNGVYVVSYGVTFGALVVSSLVPSNSFVSQALNDGSSAAKETFKKRKESQVLIESGSENQSPAS